jgi:hypothetical protein
MYRGSSDFCLEGKDVINGGKGILSVVVKMACVVRENFVKHNVVGRCKQTIVNGYELCSKCKLV